MLIFLRKMTTFKDTNTQRLWIGLMVRVVAFGPEGRRFESTKGYIPD